MDFNPLHLINELNNAIGHGTASVLEFLHITDPAVNPSGVREVATKWRTLAGAVEDSSHAAQQAMHGVVWRGKAADAFSQRAHKVHGQAASTAAALHQGATAIDKFATEADDLIAEIGNICAQIEEMEVAGLALDVLTEGFASCAATIAAGERATKIVALIAKIEESGSALGTVIKTVTEAVRGLERILESLKDIKGVTSAAKMAGEGAKFTAIGTALQDPGTFTHPGKLLDTLAEGALLGVGFGAMGKALGKAVDTLSPAALSALSKSLCKLDDLIPEGSKLRPGEDDTIRAGIANALKRFKQDPIDVVTGEMMIAQTDAQLPGILPLVLERTHLSSYRNGGWFGPSWASTLDQRLQLDDDGVVLATADGLRLCYPRPQPGLPALPERGPRMPLTWDGHPGSRMRVTDPATGRTLVFAHPTGAGADGLLDLPLQAVEDRNGNWIRIHHSIAGVPVEIEHHGGYRIAVDHHPTQPRITAYRLLDTDGPGTSTPLMRFGYDDLGHLTEVINSSDKPLRYTYDHAGRITSWTDRNHTSYHYTYDTEGRCIRGEGTAGYQSGTFTYDTTNRTTHVTNSLGHTTTIEYNDAYRPIRETDPLGNTTTTEWDTDNEHIAAVTDPLGRMTAYEYDEAGRAIVVRRADGREFRATFNCLALPLETVEPGGGIWRYAYDDKGNRLETVDPSGAVTRYTYDGRGALVEATDAVGGRRLIECNDAGLPTLINDALGNRTIMNRDALGRVTAITDALGNVTRLDWATEGNPVWREHPDGSREIWSWDGEGNLVSQTDPAGTLTSYTNTYFDLRSSVTEADGTGYQFTYDGELRPIRVTNSSGAHWDYEFDAAGHLVSETDFDGRRITYSVNAAGELVERTNGAGETVRYVRDALGRVIRLEDQARQQTTFVYDEVGRLLRAVGQHADLERTYDPLGRILSETVGGHCTEYGYDAVGNRTKRRTPSGVRTTWQYDLEGRPVEMVTAGRRIDLAYDAAGRPKARSFDGGLTITDARDESDRLLSQVTAVGDTEVQCRSYTRRHDGLVTEYEDLLDGVRHIDLDAVGRPVGVYADGWNERYAYDTHGNLTHVSTPIAEMDLEFDRTRIVRSSRASYEYDGQGRLVRRTVRLLNGQRRVWTYIWDADDRLVGAVTPLGERWRYTYDPLGRRLTKERCSESGEALEWIRFVWDGTRLSEQTSHTGATVTWDYEPGTHRPLVQTQRRSAGDACQSDVDARFHAIITDLVGAPTELVDTSGAVAWRMRGSVWGQVVEDPDYSVECPLRFPGQYHDAETGLYYNCRRYYDPDIGRYITPDPLGIDPSPNPYAYVPNPLVWADPLGLAPCKTLYHYTTEDGLEAILKSQSLRKSTGDVHARYGDGQYFTDIAPSMIKGLKKGDLTAEDMANGGLSKYQVVRSFFGRPTRWGLNKISHYVAVDVSDLDIIEGRPGTLVHLSDVDLDLAGRILEHGKTPF